ncbi:hypothetical protein ACVIHI_008572 [Bradyrhizobium sp. USDA 4524]|nr:hypothetical protein [Bradyrhizobium sp. USDA 4538]MCP1907399.1 hypothetical protein [Bradyrhizobium sp. USDA 4537]MCP1985185.1 hypothetical protein [Bradyrhizobium sp. USDA 4539]
MILGRRRPPFFNSLLGKNIRLAPDPVREDLLASLVNDKSHAGEACSGPQITYCCEVICRGSFDPDRKVYHEIIGGIHTT